MGLSGRLGGGALEFSHLRVAGGSVSGTLSGGTVQVGGLKATISGGRVTDTGFVIDSAQLTLPAYLGGAKLSARGLVWDGKDFSLAGASGNIDIKLGGDRVELAGEVKLELVEGLDNKVIGYKVTGSVDVTLPGDPPLFNASVKITVRPRDCPPDPGPCKNGAFLEEATLSIAVGNAIPLGTTGLALSGLSGSIVADGSHARRAENGEIVGVDYTITLGAKFQTHPTDSLFSGQINGGFTTRGDFALSLTEGRAFRFLDLSGGVCILIDAIEPEKNPICSAPLAERAPAAKLPGAYVRASVGAGLSYGALGHSARVTLTGTAFGSFVLAPDGTGYVRAALDGSMEAKAGGLLIRDFRPSASRFSKRSSSTRTASTPTRTSTATRPYSRPAPHRRGRPAGPPPTCATTSSSRRARRRRRLCSRPTRAPRRSSSPPRPAPRPSSKRRGPSGRPAARHPANWRTSSRSTRALLAP